ncbi:hypothetical protein [uncultured Modestobacter sp.]|uniref:hypothetical protein n=1 Tax=uncultured Modestobacter sp. TaxID=380048 RepID=UPI00261E77CC|nr:hypothetical protein [uncultured Modestobacter sp.]
MADDDIEIDAQGDNTYLVVQPSELEDVRTYVTVTPEVMDRLASDDEEDVVRRTVLFLRRHQEVADFPEVIDLDDVVASYDDYLEVMGAD